jgi:hypothetical protein
MMNFENYIYVLENFTINVNYNKQRACLRDEHFANILKILTLCALLNTKTAFAEKIRNICHYVCKVIRGKKNLSTEITSVFAFQ